MPTRADASAPRRYYPQQLPGNPDLPALLAYLRREFFSIYQGLESVEQLQVRYEAPAKPREGRLVYADGTHWNPGAGKGVYYYDGAAWVKL